MSVHVDHQTEKSDNHLGDVGNNKNPSEGATKGEVQGEGPSTIGGMVVPLTACRVRGWGRVCLSVRVEPHLLGRLCR